MRNQRLILSDEEATPKTFTQEEVNKLLAENKRGMQAKIADLQAALEGAKTAEEGQKQLSDKLKEMESSLLTVQEKAKLEMERLEKAKLNETKKLAEERDSFRAKYQDNMAKSAILQAASELKAYNPEQIYRLLRGDVTFVEENGELIPKLGINVSGKELVLPVAEAVGEFSKIENNFNLFQGEGKPGLGLRNAGNKPASLETMSYSDYVAQRTNVIGEKK